MSNATEYYVMDPVSLQPLPTVDLTPVSEHAPAPHLVSRTPSPEMGYETPVNENRSGDSISRTAALVYSSLIYRNPQWLILTSDTFHRSLPRRV